MTEVAYTVLVGLVACERLFELVLAHRNTRRQSQRGGVEFGAAHYPYMVLLHTGLLVGCVAETWLAERPFIPAIAAPSLLVLVGSQALRYWVVTTLGDRWTTRVIVVAGDRRIDSGPFRYLSHPNYVAVVAEGFALPLIHSNWITATVFTVANAFLLFDRIRVENEALRTMESGK